MSFLGDIGSFYMLILIALLILGLGMIAKGFIDYLVKKEVNNSIKNKGGNKMQSTNWLKLSLFSLAGIVVSLMILSLLSSGASMSSASNGHSSSSTSSMLGTSSSGGMSGMSSSGGFSNTATTDSSTLVNNISLLQEQITQMQNQILQLQETIQNMNMQSTPSGSGSSSSSGMPMM